MLDYSTTLKDNLKREELLLMKKLKILFPEVEAGLGHIMTSRAVYDIFTKKYGKYFDVVSLDFYKSAKSKSLHAYGKVLCQSVQTYTKHPKFGHFATNNCEFWGTVIATNFVLYLPIPWVVRKGVKYMEELKPDVIFSTHWATNYYAEHVKKIEKPFTVMYCPDAFLNALFKYKADVTMCSMKTGYEEAKNDPKFKSDNLRLTTFCIRNEAQQITNTKQQSREKLGLSNRFTVVLTEGGYGNGNMPLIIQNLLKRDLPINIIAICGTNEKLAKKFRKYSVGQNTRFIPLGYTKDIFEYINASDLFCGKAGNMIAEPTYFCVPSIISGLSTGIENHIASFYTDYIKCAILEKDPAKAADLVEKFYHSPELLEPYRKAAEHRHDIFGAEATADALFEEIKKKFNLNFDEIE